MKAFINCGVYVYPCCFTYQNQNQKSSFLYWYNRLPLFWVSYSNITMIHNIFWSKALLGERRRKSKTTFLFFFNDKLKTTTCGFLFFWLNPKTEDLIFNSHLVEDLRFRVYYISHWDYIHDKAIETASAYIHQRLWYTYS